MNIIERYLSAYIVECLTGVRGENPDNIYAVIRRTKSNTAHPVLSAVQSHLSMCDPADSQTKRFVRQMVLEGIQRPDPNVTMEEREEDELSQIWAVSPFRAEYTRKNDLALGIILMDEKPIGTFFCAVSELPHLFKTLKFAGISISER